MQIPQLQLIEDAALLKRLKHYSSDVDWIEEHRSELRGKYPNRFIAVKNRRVLFTAQTMADVVAQIKDAGASAEDCAVEYISRYEMDYLLYLEKTQ